MIESRRSMGLVMSSMEWAGGAEDRAAVAVVSVAGVAGPDWLVWNVLPEGELLGPLHAARRQALAWAGLLGLANGLAALVEEDAVAATEGGQRADQLQAERRAGEAEERRARERELERERRAAELGDERRHVAPAQDLRAQRQPLRRLGVVGTEILGSEVIEK